uniref:DNA mismatch repair protein MSH2 n=1 Tax=Kwoniella dejecticola CBS 10117 TaxID=1296121 RepID=A0A1A5ZVL4_9TREE|nr:DNA mismatch repair protein MSH2 [Kwoniella dejecticola CBS 10117]OBR81845.1 DNA mismatch repair protein MSH2 [Kwoniella dejecticola CBS 10117]
MYGSESTSAPRPQFEMDKEAEDRFCKFVERMPPKMDGMVRLFDRGDYYSAHGQDAIYIANEIFKTTNVLKYLGSGRPSTSTSQASRGLSSVTISTSLTKQFLRDALTIKQMRVEIYVPEERVPGRKDNTRWVLSKSASPGNLIQLEDLLFSDQSLSSSSVIASVKMQVKEGQKIVGVAYVDNNERLLGVGEFVEDDSFGNTESLLIQLGVKECIIQLDEKETDHDLTKLKTLVERCQVIVTPRRPADFQARNVEQDLNRLLDETNAGVALPEFDMKVAMSAMSALLIYLNLLSDTTMHGQYRLHKHDLSQYMKLDASALKALNLMPQPNETGGSKNMSLYGLLDRCKTSQGKRLLARWLKQPLVNKHEIIQRQTIVEAFVDDSNVRRKIQDDILKVMPDFHRISKKFHRRVAGLEDVVRVYQAVGQLPALIGTLEGIEPINPSAKDLIEEVYLKPLRQHADSLSNYSQMVEDTIDLTELDHHNFVLLPTFDDNLQRLKDQLLETRDQLDEEHMRVGNDLNLDTEKKLHLENHQVYKYSFRVTKAEAGSIRGHKKYIELATQKSGTIFTTATLKQLSETYFDLQGNYEKCQRHLVKEVVGIAASYTPILEILDNLIAAVDSQYSFAHVSANAPIPYVKPTLTEKGTGDVILQNARHPVLEVQDDVTFIPNHHDMRKNDSEFIILTGPNMGGKSTYIRQIGVIALLAQIGCFVPADEAQLPIFDCILARVGAGDSQLKKVSTFMAEMLETATILKSATKDSLIIIDELGRGTSTYDGFGLAWAISEHIASKIRCFCLFATHFHELTSLDQSLSHVKNLHVEALVSDKRDADGKQDRNITLLYQVKEGVCDQSFGIHVAELANFPESVVKLAKRKAEELEDFGDGDPDESLTKYTKEETDEGTALIQEFLNTWKTRTATTTNGDGEGDEDMGMSEEDMLAELRRTAEEFKEKFEANPWVRGVVNTL